MTETWLWTTWQEVGLVVLSAVLVLVALIAAVRVVGLRSLSKMSSFDFPVTVAMGSIVAAVAASSTSLAHGAIAIATLLGVQATIAKLRTRASFSAVVDNDPLLLMADGEFIDEALRSGRVTHDDVVAKLREANVIDMRQVLAVVLEPTGDVSVLHGEGPLDRRLLDGVRIVGDGATHLAAVVAD